IPYPTVKQYNKTLIETAEVKNSFLNNTPNLFINKGKQLFFGTKQDFLSKGAGDVTSAYQVILERKV
ncbi:MAG: hypothetical protein K6F97_09060, partial [Lachnospiraceae bacterium]|nr:hypothetical protein [Lachnospiraceae bacterium]